MGFGTGFITGILLSHKSDAPCKELAWKPERGTVHSRGYLGTGTDFPVQVLIRGSVPPIGDGSAKALVKWVSFTSSPDQFASADWNWVTIKKIGDTLHFMEEQKSAGTLSQLDRGNPGAGVASTRGWEPGDKDDNESFICSNQHDSICRNDEKSERFVIFDRETGKFYTSTGANRWVLSPELAERFDNSQHANSVASREGGLVHIDNWPRATGHESSWGILAACAVVVLGVITAHTLWEQEEKLNCGLVLILTSMVGMVIIKWSLLAAESKRQRKT